MSTVYYLKWGRLQLDMLDEYNVVPASYRPSEDNIHKTEVNQDDASGQDKKMPEHEKKVRYIKIPLHRVKKDVLHGTLNEEKEFIHIDIPEHIHNTLRDMGACLTGKLEEDIYDQSVDEQIAENAEELPEAEDSRWVNQVLPEEGQAKKEVCQSEDEALLDEDETAGNMPMDKELLEEHEEKHIWLMDEKSFNVFMDDEWRDKEEDTEANDALIHEELSDDEKEIETDNALMHEDLSDKEKDTESYRMLVNEELFDDDTETGSILKDEEPSDEDGITEEHTTATDETLCDKNGNTGSDSVLIEEELPDEGDKTETDCTSVNEESSDQGEEISADNNTDSEEETAACEIKNTETIVEEIKNELGIHTGKKGVKKDIRGDANMNENMEKDFDLVEEEYNPVNEKEILEKLNPKVEVIDEYDWHEDSYYEQQKIDQLIEHYKYNPANTGSYDESTSSSNRTGVVTENPVKKRGIGAKIKNLFGRKW